MKHLVKLTCGLAVALVLCVANAGATVIADWTFETSIPTSGGPLSPEVGSGTATSVGGSVYSNPAGDGSAESWSANGWDVNDYFQFQVDTTGFSDIVLDWDQGGSATGPRDFVLQYSTDNSSYTQFGGTLTILLITLTNGGFWGTGAYISNYHYNIDLSSVSAIENQSAAYFRLMVSSPTAINGAGIGTGGTSRVDNFTVSATAIPEPSTVMLVGLGLAGSLLAIRRRRS